MTYTVLCGDVSEVLPTLAPESFDAVLCDPPYGLFFMGKHWDHGVPSREVWEAVARTLKPGAHLMAFGGTRTFHRLTCAIEDAGFEIRDCCMFLHGQGFPKSLDISKAIDKAAGAEREVLGYTENARPNRVGKPTKLSGLQTIGGEITEPATPDARHWQGYGTALKPAWEPCILAMKPTCGTFAENALRHGVAGLNVDGGRIAGSDTTTRHNSSSSSYMTRAIGAVQPRQDEYITGSTLGRWPANLILNEGSARLLDEMSGERKAGNSVRGDEPSIPAMHDGGLKRVAFSSHGDTGGASRFFYCAKSSRREREAGLEGLPPRFMATMNDGIGQREHNAQHPSAHVRNHHPTIKPLALCEYLARLILPPKRDTPRRLLVPFSGSGSEMIGALLAGWDEVVGIEREAEYVAIAEARLRHWTDGAQLELSA